MQTNFNEKCLERNKLKEEIKKKSDEIAAFIEQCQELYNKELARVSYIMTTNIYIQFGILHYYL